jgi:hypothetical protein
LLSAVVDQQILYQAAVMREELFALAGPAGQGREPTAAAEEEIKGENFCSEEIKVDPSTLGDDLAENSGKKIGGDGEVVCPVSSVQPFDGRSGGLEGDARGIRKGTRLALYRIKIKKTNQSAALAIEAGPRRTDAEIGFHALMTGSLAME